jgi:hypothetical protein
VTPHRQQWPFSETGSTSAHMAENRKAKRDASFCGFLFFDNSAAVKKKSGIFSDAFHRDGANAPDRNDRVCKHLIETNVCQNL